MSQGSPNFSLQVRNSTNFKLFLEFDLIRRISFPNILSPSLPTCRCCLPAFFVHLDVGSFHRPWPLLIPSPTFSVHSASRICCSSRRPQSHLTSGRVWTPHYARIGPLIEVMSWWNSMDTAQRHRSKLLQPFNYQLSHDIYFGKYMDTWQVPSKRKVNFILFNVYILNICIIY